jgi:DNA-binding transcriptional regulator LsrR (DeoR family)
VDRRCDKLVEPTGLSVLREYEIPWKKQTLDVAKLAFLRFEEGLGSRQIAARLGISRTTAITAIHRLERERGLR